MRAGSRSLVGAVAAALLLIAPATAGAATERASQGPVTAEMSYAGSSSQARNLRIRVIRDGRVLLDRRAPGACKTCVALPGGGDGRSSVRIARLDADPEPEVIFDLFTGGAHCCWYSLIYGYDAAADAYRGLRHMWLDAGYRLVDRDHDGAREFQTRDDRFAYVFAPYASSQYPPQIWRYDAGRMLDVTRSYPAVARRAALGQLRKYRHRRRRADVRAILAAYVADECLLGRCGRGFGLVREANQRGDLDRMLPGESGPHGNRFVRKLRRFLRRTGYL